MRDYREKNVMGMIVDITKPMPHFCNVTVRMTSDNKGKSLSLAAANVMIQIPLEEVEDIIWIAEKE